MKLMLIEDEKKEQDKFKKLAEKMNDVTFVKITNSTEEGIKCLKENDIDGVILDLELNSGIGNGFEFLEKLKITKLSKIPKIVVTTNVYSDSVYDYLHQNKVDFIFYKKQENYNVENVITAIKNRSEDYNAGVRLHGKPQTMLTDDAVYIVENGYTL